MKYAWKNDKFVHISESGMSFTSAGFRYGINIFDAIRVTVNRVHGSKVFSLFRPQLHVKRLLEGCANLGLRINRTEEEILEFIIQVVQKNNPDNDFGIRIFAYLGSENLMEAEPVDLVIFPIPLELVALDRPYKLKVSEHTRMNDEILPYSIKCTAHYVRNRTALVQYNHDYDDLIFLNNSGAILETSRANIFVVKNNKIYTPINNKNEFLSGVTRCSLIQVIEDHDMEIVECEIRLSDLWAADEVFITSTSIGIRSVNCINEKLFKESSITSWISNLYSSINHLQIPEYNHWMVNIHP